MRNFKEICEFDWGGNTWKKCDHRVNGVQFTRGNLWGKYGAIINTKWGGAEPRGPKVARSTRRPRQINTFANHRRSFIHSFTFDHFLHFPKFASIWSLFLNCSQPKIGFFYKFETIKMRSSLKLTDCLIHHRPNPMKSSVKFVSANVSKRQFSQRAIERFHSIAATSPIDSIPNRVLITGGMGQLGRSFAQVLASILGPERVMLSDICRRPADFDGFCAYRHLDILDRGAIQQIVVDEEIDMVIHFSALLSALGEQNVELALQVNCQGVQNVLQVAKSHKCRLFIPSTIGVFGEFTPRQLTPDVTIQRPSTIYGVSKVFAELLGEYFWHRFGTDFRSIRLPGIISTCKPGGGTTDYAIQMFWDALRDGRHICYLRPDTQLPMLFEEDCMAGMLGIIMAPTDSLSLRTYNVAGFSCTPAQLADRIHQYLPSFQVKYEPCPIRQKIADSWPQSLDDSTARRDWAWNPEFSLDRTVTEMLHSLGHSMPEEKPLMKEERQIEMPAENVGIFGGILQADKNNWQLLKCVHIL